MLPCFHASMIPASMLPLPQITTTNNYWSRKQKLWQDSICKDVIHSMPPCFLASMLLCFHAFVLTCLHAYNACMVACFHALMLSCFNVSMLPCFNDSTSMLSGLHLRQVRHVRISISTKFQKMWLTDGQTWPLIQMLSHLKTAKFKTYKNRKITGQSQLIWLFIKTIALDWLDTLYILGIRKCNGSNSPDNWRLFH